MDYKKLYTHQVKINNAVVAENVMLLRQLKEAKDNAASWEYLANNRLGQATGIKQCFDTLAKLKTI